MRMVGSWVGLFGGFFLDLAFFFLYFATWCLGVQGVNGVLLRYPGVIEQIPVRYLMISEKERMVSVFFWVLNRSIEQNATYFSCQILADFTRAAVI